MVRRASNAAGSIDYAGRSGAFRRSPRAGSLRDSRTRVLVLVGDAQPASDLALLTVTRNAAATPAHHARIVPYRGASTMGTPHQTATAATKVGAEPKSRIKSWLESELA